MKYLLSTALIATLAITTAALAFGPGNGRYFGINGQQAQSSVQNGQAMMRGQGRRMGQTMRPNIGTNQNAPQAQGQWQGMGQMRGQANGTQTREPVFMDSWDDNEDGTVTLAEAKTRRIDLFDALDENEDGKVVSAEFDSFLNSQKMPPEEATNGQRGLFGMTLAFNDQNKDGSVDKEEFLGQSLAFLQGMDRDGDGKLSDADFGQRQGQMGRGNGRGNGQGRGQGQGRGWFQQQS